MVLAEALLRVPDAATTDRLIEDKLGQGDFAHHETKSDALLVSASAWALSITSRIILPGETPHSIVAGLAKRIGLPAVRSATRQAMRVMGNHFVLGETIEAALKRAGSGSGRLTRYSFDMLGEGARTAEDADALFRQLRRCDRGDRPRRRQQGLAGTARHLGEALGAASALRGDEPRARHGRARAPRHRARPQRESPRPQLHGRCRGSRPAGAFARRDRRSRGRPVARRHGTVSASRCKPIRNVRSRSSIGWPRSPRRSTGASWCASSRAPIGTPRSSARRSAAFPAIRCSRARR